MQGCMQSGRRGLEHDDLSPLGDEGLLGSRRVFFLDGVRDVLAD